MLSCNVDNKQDGKSQVGAISKAQIKSKGGPFGDKKISRKSRTVPKKNRKGDPLVPCGFVGYV